MRIVNEISLEDFEAWSGGRDTLDTLIEKGLCEQLEAILDDECISGTEGWSDTSLNDFLRFERDTIAEWLGFSSWEELENGKQEEDEDEYTEEEANSLLFESIGNGESFRAFCGNFNGCGCCPFNHECETFSECEAKYKEMMEEYKETQGSENE